MAKKDKTQIFIHASATRPDWMAGQPVEAKREEIRRWHKERGWRDIGYAVIIDRDGSVAYGRDLDSDGDFYEETAAAARGYNTKGVHICLLGAFGSAATDKFEDHFTLAQDRVARAEIKKIMGYTGRKMWVRGHNEVAAKACPGFQVGPWYENKPQRSNPVSSTTIQASVAAAVTNGGIAATAVSKLEGNAQLLAIGGGVLVTLLLLYIMRERLKKWARGVI